MNKTKLSIWEKIKRVVAHSFHLETRLEIKERYERLEFEKKQEELRLKHHQYIRSLMIEYADDIEQFHAEKAAREQAEKEEIERKKRVELYKSNNWDKYLSSNKQQEETAASEEETI
jgi:hypothetical protein